MIKTLSSLFFSSVFLDRESFLPVENLYHLLSSEERLILDQRNYQTDLRRRQFVYGRLLLKQLLYSKFNIQIQSLTIAASESGAPSLILDGVVVDNVGLSIAHYDNSVFGAVGFNCRCGVDVQSVFGVDWSAVLRAMEWSVSFDGQWLGISFDPRYDNYVSPQLRSALIWSGYEAWYKCNDGVVFPSDFRLHQVRLLWKDTVTHSMIFEMFLACGCSYNSYITDCIYLRVSSDEIFAVAVQGF